MEITQTVNEGLKREIKVIVPAGDLETKLSERIATLSKQVTLKGFRPGKVPIDHLRRVYGKNVMAEVIQETLDESSRKAVEDSGERPAFQPEIQLSEDKDEIEAMFSGNADLSYTMAFEVLPEIPKPDTSSIKLERQVAEVSDADVNEALERIASSNKPYETRKDSEKAQDGDKVVIDFLGKLDGTPFEGGADEDAELVLGSMTFIPGFEEKLVGLKVGDEKTIEIDFPEKYPNEKLAGQSATFDVKMKSISAPQEITIDEAFAESLGVESLDKMKEMVSEQLETENKTQSRAKLKRRMLDALDKSVTIELPQKLVDQEFEGMWNQLTTSMAEAGQEFKDDDDEATQKADYQRLSERRVRLGLVLAEVGKDGSIEVTEEELNRAVIEEVRRYPGQEQQVFEFIKENPQAINNIRAPLFEDKVIDYLLEMATVDEKSVSREELMADDPEDNEKA
jgi:trigger factor